MDDCQRSNLLASQQWREYGTSLDSLSCAFEAEYLARLLMDRNRDRARGRVSATNGESHRYGYDERDSGGENPEALPS